MPSRPRSAPARRTAFPRWPAASFPAGPRCRVGSATRRFRAVRSTCRPLTALHCNSRRSTVAWSPRFARSCCCSLPGTDDR
ncbi:hypothetical protein DF186_16930, partial [Enterococcus hirae]